MLLFATMRGAEHHFQNEVVGNTGFSVARWYIFIPKSKLWHILGGLGVENLVHLIDI
jgi:hypothetical protein